MGTHEATNLVPICSKQNAATNSIDVETLNKPLEIEVIFSNDHEVWVIVVERHLRVRVMTTPSHRRKYEGACVAGVPDED
eukprot:CAMPEP_0180810506 /NCGR_PEP_ID=MMETSP1038_2-20121128/64923_1 /TAXON_ID=632150 /ORGANISM="Azadinium spinosum, Strain 3D9" /LENGTH=79 /DNA_ID=CAMNT_0022851805 /DNA_START=144 /DNA_END=380 /DNA_ORIENTATION=-